MGDGAGWCSLVYRLPMPERPKAELIEVGLETQEQERQRFLGLAERIASATDPRERERLKEELARLTFG